MSAIHRQLDCVVFNKSCKPFYCFLSDDLPSRVGFHPVFRGRVYTVGYLGRDNVRSRRKRCRRDAAAEVRGAAAGAHHSEAAVQFGQTGV